MFCAQVRVFLAGGCGTAMSHRHASSSREPEQRQATALELDVFRQTLSRSAGGPYDGRKRKLSPQEEYDLSQCLSQVTVPDERIRRLWNLATASQEDPPHVSEKMLKHRVKIRLAAGQDCFKVLNFKGVSSEEATVPVLLGSLKPLLQLAAERSDTWKTLIAEAAESCAGPRKVTFVLYADEVVCGNIIQQVSQKKVTAVYCFVKEARRHAGYPDAWLMLACLQADVLRSISGGLSAVMSAVANEVCSSENQAGFPVDCGSHGVKWFSTQAPALYLADLDACRGAFGLKGSAGVVPCLWCSNVVTRHSHIDLEGFVGVDEADMTKFVRRNDAEVFQLVDDMSAIQTSVALERRQKVLGMHLLPEGVLLCARKSLPPSSCLVDAYHAYFVQGIANWEIGMMKELLHKEGFSLDTLRGMAVEHDWKQVGFPNVQTESALRRLFSEKNFGSGIYKADGHEVWSMVPLFAFYAETLLADKETCQNELRSFALLCDICAELRHLRYEPKPLLNAQQTQRLERLQEMHQQACLVAYGKDYMRPKHHNRLHLGEATRKLSWLPLTLQHEKKHQLIKGTGMLDNQSGKLSNSLALQKTLLPRCLLATLESADSFGLGKWDLLDPVIRASTSLEDVLFDRPLQLSRNLQLGPRQLTKGDVVQWHDYVGVCEYFVRGKKVGLLMELWELTLKEKKPWGAIWMKAKRTLMVKPSADINFKVVPWWRAEGQEIWTL